MSKKIAVFGDIHGHFRLMFQLCRLWQIKNETYLDGIFQCGDMGFFSDYNSIDRSTKMLAEPDPEQLGFKYFTKPPLMTDEMLTEIVTGVKSDFSNVKCPLHFCHGNHEDFHYLASQTEGMDICSIDCFNKFLWLRPGLVHELHGIRVASIGGAPEKVLFKPEDSLILLWKWVNQEFCQNLYEKDFDVLITHCSPRGIGGESDLCGSKALKDLVEKAKPKYIFFGHHSLMPRFSKLGETKCFWLDDVNFTHVDVGLSRPLKEGCMGILNWEDSENNYFQIVNDDWIKNLNSLNWWEWDAGFFGI
jgi:predicted phosphodiesterase